MLGDERVETHSEAEWIYKPPRDPGAKTFLLSSGGVACIGSWRNTVGMVAYFPLPKRNKKTEQELGLISEPEHNRYAVVLDE